MHDLKRIITDTEEFKKNMSRRKIDLGLIDKILDLDAKRRNLIQQVENARAEVKKISQEIGQLKKNGQDATEKMQKVGQIKGETETYDKNLEEILTEQKNILAIIPNTLMPDVPEGFDETCNLEVKRHGEVRTFNFTPKDHVELGQARGWLDFEAGTKISASRFVVYKGLLAKLERALINFMLDEHTANGYTEIMAPFMVNEQTMFGTGQLPKFKEDLFKIEGRDWYLIPTAEVPLTNLKKDELFNYKELPFLFCGYTPCFRSEAGSYGKDTRGLIRLHQFNKVELVAIVSAESSEEMHARMIARAENILEKLGLPYRSMLLCGGDQGFSASKCVDLEVWLPGQNRYREISSISNCTDFQARRASIRYRDKDGKPQYAHTLNGSGLAVGRTVVAIMENYQNEDGTIMVPQALRSYMSGLEVLD